MQVHFCSHSLGRDNLNPRFSLCLILIIFIPHPQLVMFFQLPFAEDPTSNDFLN